MTEGTTPVGGPMKPRERILKEATFSPKAVTYHVMPSVVFLCGIIVGIPLAIVFGPLMHWYYTRHYRRLRVILTSRDLRVHRGILNREEKSIPLEKITDLAVYQGPVMRYYGIKGIRIETAGQTTGLGALVTVIGIEDTDGFRDMVLNQRDRIADPDDVPSPAPAVAQAGGGASTDGAVLQVLGEMRDSLQRIEELMRERT